MLKHIYITMNEVYWYVGKITYKLSENSTKASYGKKIIDELSVKLTNELGKGYTPSRLRYFRRFFFIFSKCPTLSDKFSLFRYCEIIWKNDFNKINYYIQITVNHNLSGRQLRQRIKSNEYERLYEKARNKLINKEKQSIVDFVKNSIIIKNKKFLKRNCNLLTKR